MREESRGQGQRSGEEEEEEEEGEEEGEEKGVTRDDTIKHYVPCEYDVGLQSI